MAKKLTMQQLGEFGFKARQKEYKETLRRLKTRKTAPVTPKIPTGARNSFFVEKWEERDRLHIGLLFNDGRSQHDVSVADWWDDDARQMFEDGFFKPGSRLKDSVIDSANEMGIIKLT